MIENVLFYWASSVGDPLFKPSDRNKMAGACNNEKRNLLKLRNSILPKPCLGVEPSIHLSQKSSGHSRILHFIYSRCR